MAARMAGFSRTGNFEALGDRTYDERDISRWFGNFPKAQGAMLSRKQLSKPGTWWLPTLRMNEKIWAGLCAKQIEQVSWRAVGDRERLYR